MQGYHYCHVTPSSHVCSSRYNALLTDSTQPRHVICMAGLRVRCDHSTDGLKKQYDHDQNHLFILFFMVQFLVHTHIQHQCNVGWVVSELLQSRSAGHARDELHHQGMQSSVSSSSRLYSQKIYDNLSHYEDHNTSFYTKKHLHSHPSLATA